jgi:hypothetical protein
MQLLMHRAGEWSRGKGSTSWQGEARSPRGQRMDTFGRAARGSSS